MNIKRCSPEKVGMTNEDWTELSKRFAEEMRTYKVALRVYFVWGQKPEVENSEPTIPGNDLGAINESNQ
jgi:hypothetical protein